MNEPADARRSPRYACHGPIQFRINKWEIKGKIINLCLEGCLIRPTREFGLEEGDEFNLRFQVNGLSFRVRAIVRHVGKNDTIGVEILRLSGRVQAQLRELLEELADAQPQLLKSR
ncbi:MAG TPA: PilZ domain-containing protein [Edaphobacter sp.]